MKRAFAGLAPMGAAALCAMAGVWLLPHLGQPREEACRPVVLDPLSGAIADGTVRGVGSLPGCIVPLSEAPATLVDVQPLNQGEFMDSPLVARVIAFRGVELAEGSVARLADIAPGSVIRRGILKNPGPFKVQVTIVADHSLNVVELEPGFGLLIGDESLAGPTYKAAGRCECTCESGDMQYITIECPEPESRKCDIAEYNGLACQRGGDGSWGTTQHCQRVLLPITPAR